MEIKELSIKEFCAIMEDNQDDECEGVIVDNITYGSIEVSYDGKSLVLFNEHAGDVEYLVADQIAMIYIPWPSKACIVISGKSINGLNREVYISFLRIAPVRI